MFFQTIMGLAMSGIVSAQLAPAPFTLGPLTTSDEKWAKKICDVTKFGAVADLSTDIGPALLAAFNDCIDGGVGMKLLIGTICVC
jgi:rhamnogalacturonan hydrolase